MYTLNQLEGVNPNEIFTRFFSPYEFGKKNERSVDPTVIIETATFIAGLFKKENDGPAWLPKILGDLNKIKKLLDTIIDILDQLKIYIDEKFRQDYEADVVAWSNTVALNSTEFWATQGTQNERIQRLHDDLVKSASKYMGYGYAFPNSIAFALRTEVNIFDLLKLPIEFRVPFYKTYSDYFGNCLNENIPGSIGNKLKDASISLKNFEDSNPNEDNEREILTISYHVSEHGGNEGHPSGTEYSFKVFASVNFNLQESRLEASMRIGKEYEGRFGVYEGSRSSALIAAKKYFEDFLNNYRQIIIAYKNLLTKVKLLEQAKLACEMYKAESDALLIKPVQQ